MKTISYIHSWWGIGTVALLGFGTGYFFAPKEKNNEEITNFSKDEKARNLKTENELNPGEEFRSNIPVISDIIASEPLRKKNLSIKELLLNAKGESNPIKRNAAFSTALASLNEENLDQAIEVFKSLPLSFENAQEYRMLLYAWGQFDPGGAIEYCNSRASGIGAGFSVAGVLEGLASRDPGSAKEWVANPENSGMAKIYNFGLVRGWASQDLEGATAYVEGLEKGDDVRKLVGILTEQHNKKGFSSAAQWAEGLIDEKMKESAFESLSKQVSRDRPESVANWLKSHANQNYATKSFENLGKRWSETNPESAVAYFEELPEGNAQQKGIESAMANWAKKDPESAGQWLNQKEPSPKLDPALSTYARVVSNEDGAAAMEWAISITDQKLQEKTITQVGQSWYRKDKESVENWLPESGLSEKAQAAIKNPPKQNWWQKLR